MTNKITEETIKKLIEEVLKEDTVRITRDVPENETDDGKWFKALGINASSAKEAAQLVDKSDASVADKLKKFRKDFADNVLGLDDEPDNLTNLDMDIALSKSKKTNARKYVDAVLTNTGTGAWTDYQPAGNLDNLSGRAKSGTIGTASSTVYNPETFTMPRLYTAPSDAGASSFLGSQNELMLSIFKKNTIVERLKELDILTNNIFYNEDWYNTNKNEPRIMLQAMMMVDLITHMSKEISGYSGDGFFESFCALICGGNVIGTDMGSADFLTADGKYGSSKYYQKYVAMKQAVSGFEKGKVDRVHYVMAIKSKGKQQTSAAVAKSSGATTKAHEITYIDLHYSIVDLVSEKNGKKNFTIHNANGELLSTQNGLKKGSSIALDKDHTPKDTYVGTLRLVAGGVPWQNAFEQNLEDGSAKKAFEASKNFFKELFAAEEQTKTYIAKDKGSTAQSIITSGNSALKAFDNADEHLSSLVTLLSGGKKIKGARKSRKLREQQKITSDFLRKLIEESFKK